MKKHGILILLLAHLLHPVCLLIGLHFGLVFELFSDWGYYLILTALTLWLTKIADPSPWAYGLLPVMIFSGFAAILGTSWASGGLVAMYFLSRTGTLSRKLGAKGIKKWLILVPTLILAIILVFFTVGDLFVETMRQVTVIQEVPSPDGQHTALLIDADYGATGGDTLIRVRDNLTVRNLGFGTFYDAPIQPHRGPWGEFYELDLRWLDEHTLTDGKRNYSIP